MTKISEDRFVQATNDHEGWCSTCEDFTHECAEPDAQDYRCPVCREWTVMGAEMALLSGEITFDDNQG